jgi:hypothetical protein
MRNNKYLSKKEIRSVFRVLNIKSESEDVKTFPIVEKDDLANQSSDIWIIADSTSAFSNLNSKEYGKLESSVR